MGTDDDFRGTEKANSVSDMLLGDRRTRMHFVRDCIKIGNQPTGSKQAGKERPSIQRVAEGRL